MNAADLLESYTVEQLAAREREKDERQARDVETVRRAIAKVSADMMRDAFALVPHDEPQRDLF